MLSLEEHEARLREIGIGVQLVGVDPDVAAKELKRIERRTRTALRAVRAEGAQRAGYRAEATSGT